MLKKGVVKILKFFHLDGIASNIFNAIISPIKFNHMMRFYSKFIPAKSLCFDIGANKGNRVDVFLKLGASIVAVEPQPGCIKLLQQKYEKSHQVFIVPKAVGRKPGKAKLFVHERNPLWTMSSMNPKWINAQKSRSLNQENWT